MIISLRNDKVRLVRALQSRRRMRQREGRLAIEGVRLCEEATRAGVVPNFVLRTPSVAEGERPAALLSAWEEAGVLCYEVSEEVMAACSDVETPQGLLAVVPTPRLARPAHPTLTVIVDRLHGPGNLGTILRTALAAEVEQVLLAPGTVDPTNPKVVRAAAGAHFRLPLAQLSWRSIAEQMAGCRVYLAAARGGRSHSDVDWREPVALVVGGEAQGASRTAQALASEAVSIPMAAGVESLNAAVATAVLLFEAARQRRLGSG